MLNNHQYIIITIKECPMMSREKQSSRAIYISHRLSLFLNVRPLKGSRRDDILICKVELIFPKIHRVWKLNDFCFPETRTRAFSCPSPFPPFILSSCQLMLLLPVRQIIIESLDESAPTDPIDLVKVSFEEAVERGIDLIDVPLGKAIEHRTIDLVEITWPYIHHGESPERCISLVFTKGCPR